MVRPSLYNKEKNERRDNGTKQRKDLFDVREKV